MVYNRGMNTLHHLAGVYAAAITPLTSEFSPDLEALPEYLGFLAKRGCHGALLLGTTGEGPSFAPEERIALCRAALAVRQEQPQFHLLAGTGTPSLTETIGLTRAAFDLGFDGVVVLPPYYYRDASEDGLFAWFSQVIRQAVPAEGALFAYHIPAVSGVGFSLDLLARLKDAFPSRFAGMKDSSGNPEFTRQLGKHFGKDLLVLTGNDGLLSLALENAAGGCITAPANLLSPYARQVWEGFFNGQPDPQAQERLTSRRDTMKRFAPYPPMLKIILARRYGFPRWSVRPPMLPFSPEIEEQIVAELDF
jgi:4-hydroxy-tetrahydrodipicolinate synthase